jgi:hypothetical protein
MFTPHRKHITSLLRAQPLNAIYKLVTMLYHKKKTPWPLVRVRTIPTERPPLVDEI